jgi:hypothetical protein
VRGYNEEVYDWDDPFERRRYERDMMRAGYGVTMPRVEIARPDPKALARQQRALKAKAQHREGGKFAKTPPPVIWCACDVYSWHGRPEPHVFGDESYECGKKMHPEKFTKCCSAHGWRDTGFDRDELHPYDKYKDTDDIFFDTYPGGTKHVDGERGTWSSWRAEWERTGQKYALYRMEMYDVPAELTMFDKGYVPVDPLAKVKQTVNQQVTAGTKMTLTFSLPFLCILFGLLLMLGVL